MNTTNTIARVEVTAEVDVTAGLDVGRRAELVDDRGLASLTEARLTVAVNVVDGQVADAIVDAAEGLSRLHSRDADVDAAALHIILIGDRFDVESHDAIVELGVESTINGDSLDAADRQTFDDRVDALLANSVSS